MKRQNVLRFSQVDFCRLQDHFQKAGRNESQAFGLCSRADNPKCSILIADKLILPGPKELKNQSSVSIEPAQKLQAMVYGLGYDTRSSVVECHTHPFTEKPHFSLIDDFHGTEEAIYLSQNLPEPATMAMVVFGGDLKHFEARVWNRSKSCFEPIDRLEILGSPIQILAEDALVEVPEDDPYARHRIIPGWQQGRLEKLKVFVCGLGGNGAVVWQGLVALGVGKDGGWLKACDPDVVEASNLPRILYALPKDVGRSKAAIAQAYARKKAPQIHARCYQESIDSQRMLDAAKESNVIIVAVDNDGARKICNRLAIRYLIPLLNIGSEIIPEDSTYQAVGQVQALIPGQTGCLVCSSAIDLSEAALDLMPEEIQAERAKAGYVRGTSETPTPSILHLNGVPSYLAISQFLRLVFDEQIKGKEFLHYDRQSCQLVTASVLADPNCPVCGTKGYLGAGDEQPGIGLGYGDEKSGPVVLVDGEVIEESDEQTSAPQIKSTEPVSRAEGLKEQKT